MYNIYEYIENLIINAMKRIKNKGPYLNNPQEEVNMMLLVALTKLIIIKKEITEKQKNTDNIKELYPKQELDNIVFKGQFNIYETPISKTTTKILEKPINILEINDEYKNDSIWIINTIRDSIAHGNFSLDFDKQKIIIKNIKQYKKLICEIDFYWLIRISNILSTNRIENNSNKLKLAPFMLTNEKIEQKKNPMSNVKEVKQLFKNINYYYQTVLIGEKTPVEKIKDIKIKINNFWENTRNKIEEEFLSIRKINVCDNEIIMSNLNKFYEKVENNFGNEVESIEMLYCTEIPDKVLDLLSKKILSIKEFTKMDYNTQKVVALKFISLLLYNYDQKDDEKIEMGLDCLMSIDYGQTNELAKKYYEENNEEYIGNLYCYDEEKMISLLYMEGLLNFALNKESIFDKYINYDALNLSKIKIYDYEEYNKKYNNLKKIENKLREIEKQITNITKDISNIKKLTQENHKKQNTLNIKEEKLKLLKEEILILKKEKESLQVEISNSEYDYNENKRYLKITSKEKIFRHIRNALAHTWMGYDDDKITDLMRRKVSMKDKNQKGKITFKCEAEYIEWLELFMSNEFKNIEIQKESTKILEHKIK